MSKQVVKRIVVVSAGVMVVGVVTVGVLWWWYVPVPVLLDGPFHGSPASPVETGTPDQAFPIYNGFTLEVYDSSSEGVSPIVQLREATGSVKWAIHADGFETGDVTAIRFTESHRGYTRSGTVMGSVRWTYGHENARWYITGDGDLRDYRFAW